MYKIYISFGRYYKWFAGITSDQYKEIILSDNSDDACEVAEPGYFIDRIVRERSPKMIQLFRVD